MFGLYLLVRGVRIVQKHIVLVHHIIELLFGTGLWFTRCFICNFGLKKRNNEDSEVVWKGSKLVVEMI